MTTILRRVAATASLLAMALLTLGEAGAEAIPALPDIAPATAAAHPALLASRTRLLGERSRLRERTDQHNAACRSVLEDSPQAARCDAALEALSNEVDRHIDASWKLIRQHLIDSMALLAKRVPDWSTAEQGRLSAALKSLKPDGDAKATGTAIRQAWTDVLARGQTAELAQQAAQGDGPGLYAAGQQTVHEDCAVFALATAVGRPYGLVAARAAELIRDGEWRTAAERAEPQKTIERAGLNGGEVILLAEIFGQVEVVRGTDFAKTLKSGRPVMVNLVPASGNVNGGHQVVLTKTFQHLGASWYEMIDSNQGPVRRLYLSATELSTMQQENGFAFRPEERTTPLLLR